MLHCLHNDIVYRTPPLTNYCPLSPQVKVLKLLKHPNIVAHYDNFVADKSLVIVMEYAPGGTLHEFIQDRNGTLMEEDVRRLY